MKSDRAISPLPGLPRLVVFALAAVSIGACLAAAAIAGSFRISNTHFPSSLGITNLVRTRVDLAGDLRFETWRYPSGLSYSFWVPFESLSSTGDRLQCRVEAEGWVRTMSGHRNLMDLYCVCERPSLHSDRETSCPGLP
jgi:hypothetical protein